MRRRRLLTCRRGSSLRLDLSAGSSGVKKRSGEETGRVSCGFHQGRLSARNPREDFCFSRRKFDWIAIGSPWLDSRDSDFWSADVRFLLLAAANVKWHLTFFSGGIFRTFPSFGFDFLFELLCDSAQRHSNQKWHFPLHLFSLYTPSWYIFILLFVQLFLQFNFLSLQFSIQFSILFPDHNEELFDFPLSSSPFPCEPRGD